MAIAACTRARDWGVAVQLLQRMRDGRAGAGGANAHAYSAAMAACTRGGEWRRALALFQQMEEDGVPPNATCFAAAARAHAASARGAAPALELLHTMRARGMAPDAQVFGTVLLACCVAGRWKETLGVLVRVSAHD